MKRHGVGLRVQRGEVWRLPPRGNPCCGSKHEYQVPGNSFCVVLADRGRQYPRPEMVSRMLALILIQKARGALPSLYLSEQDEDQLLVAHGALLGRVAPWHLLSMFILSVFGVCCYYERQHVQVYFQLLCCMSPISFIMLLRVVSKGHKAPSIKEGRKEAFIKFQCTSRYAAKSSGAVSTAQNAQMPFSRRHDRLCRVLASTVIPAAHGFL